MDVILTHYKCRMQKLLAAYLRMSHNALSEYLILPLLIFTAVYLKYAARITIHFTTCKNAIYDDFVCLGYVHLGYNYDMEEVIHFAVIL